MRSWMDPDVDIDQLPIEEVIDKICTTQEALSQFWSNAGGWAPVEAAELLSKSRLDWQVSLSHCLKTWMVKAEGQQQAGQLILAWANLGSLVEGTLMLLLSVHYTDYKTTIESLKKERLRDPETLKLDWLRTFVRDHVWTDSYAQKWDPWISKIKDRRNAVHAFKDRQIGSHDEFLKAVRTYLLFLRFVDGHLPYPDGHPE